MSDGERLDGPHAEIRELRSRLEQLPHSAQAVFALACAERTVRAAAGGSAQAMAEPLALGWSAVLGGPGRCGPARDSVKTRADLETDEVAAVFYALGAVLGLPGEAWWAATRSMDAAFKRGNSAPPKRRLFARDKAAPTEPVQQELQWQYEALVVLAREGASPAAVLALRRTPDPD